MTQSAPCGTSLCVKTRSFITKSQRGIVLLLVKHQQFPPTPGLCVTVTAPVVCTVLFHSHNPITPPYNRWDPHCFWFTSLINWSCCRFKSVKVNDETFSSASSDSYYIHHGGYVFICVCLCISRITQKLQNWIPWHFVEGWVMTQVKNQSNLRAVDPNKMGGSIFSFQNVLNMARGQ